MKTKRPPRVLLSPLDWGLGHTTRCIPIIKALLDTGCSLYIACDATAQALLSREFPTVYFLPLQGYSIRYASSKRWFATKILQQVPKIISAIWREHKWLKKIVAEYKFDLIISDNRYGLFHYRVPSILITHQLSIQTPFSWLSHSLQLATYRLINKFSECWVPDYEGKTNLAAALSHPQKFPRVPVHYIGPLSRFQQTHHQKIRYQFLFVLSGPEPQRTLLENAVLQVISTIQYKVLLIRGLPNESSIMEAPNNCTVFNHLPTAELQTAFAQSEFVVSRSGYTTVMELILLQKKAVLIPTPGQTEQEYLARHLMKQHWCYACNQDEDLREHLQRAMNFPFLIPALPKLSLHHFIKTRVDEYMNEN